MTKIRCTLPNASEEMNGIKFAVDAGGGVVSVDAVPDDLAEIFLSIPGFTAEAVKGKPPVDPEEAARKQAEADRLKQEKLDTAQAAKDKKAAETQPKPPKLTAKEKAALAAAEKAEAADTTTPPVVEGAAADTAEGNANDKPADETTGKQEGEE